MKEWKTIVMIGLAIIVVLLVVGRTHTLSVLSGGQSVTPEEKALSNLKTQIEQFKILKEERTLTRDIMVLQQEIKELNLKAQAPPVIEGEFIPMERLPEEMQE